MHIGLVGSGPALRAARDAVESVADSTASLAPKALGTADIGIVSGETGADVFATANRAALASGTPWVAVERGGVGGVALDSVAAAVSGFAPTHGCYDCLRARVTANASADDGVSDDDADAQLAGAIAGREIIRLVAGEPSTVLGGVIEVPHAQRRFLPVPGCDCGDDHTRSLDRTHRQRELDEALAAAEQSVDTRVGLISQVGEVESFPAPYYLATLADTDGFSDVQANRNAAGVAADWNAAFMKAIGEGLERYAAGVYRAATFDRVPAATQPAAVPPSRFVCHPDFETPDPDRPIRWVSGQQLATGATVSLPAEFVHFPPPESRHRPAITTGLGLGNSGTEALLSGLYEVVERDAAMVAWYSTFEPLGLAVDDDRWRELRKRATAESLEATALLLTTDVDIPTVAACLHRDSGTWPRFAAGLSADLDPATAAADALAEALQNWLELRGMGREDAREEAGAVDSYAEFPPAARRFVTPDSTVPAASVGPADPVSGATELDTVVDRVVDAGLEPYAASLTTRDVEALEFEAARVLIPSAQPLFTDSAYFGERAERVPQGLGFEPQLDRDHHPFP